MFLVPFEAITVIVTLPPIASALAIVTPSSMDIEAPFLALSTSIRLPLCANTVLKAAASSELITAFSLILIMEKSKASATLIIPYTWAVTVPYTLPATVSPCTVKCPSAVLLLLSITLFEWTAMLSPATVSVFVSFETSIFAFSFVTNFLTKI